MKFDHMNQMKIELIHPEDQENDQEFEQQEEGNDQGGRDYGDVGESRPQVPHPRVDQSIQRDHPVDNILDDIEKGVITRSRAATFCEHYSFVSSFDSFRVESVSRSPSGFW